VLFEPGMSCQLCSFYEFLCICISGEQNGFDVIITVTNVSRCHHSDARLRCAQWCLVDVTEESLVGPAPLSTVYDDPHAHYYCNDELLCVCIERYRHVHCYSVTFCCTASRYFCRLDVLLCQVFLVWGCSCVRWEHWNVFGWMLFLLLRMAQIGLLYIISRSCHLTYPLGAGVELKGKKGAGVELKGNVVVGLREIYIALARFIIASALLYCRGLSVSFSGQARR